MSRYFAKLLPMIDRDRIHGGFDGSLRSQMSPALRRQIDESEAAEARDARRLERERAAAAEDFANRAIQGAIAAAVERGEEVNPRALRGEQLGHTPSKFIAMVSAEQDRADAWAAAKQAAAYRKWQAEHAALHSGDFTAPTEQERAAQAERDERHREARLNSSVRRYERSKAVQEARQAAWRDTSGAVVGLARAVDADRQRYGR
jgi:hypothetical protein